MDVIYDKLSIEGLHNYTHMVLALKTGACTPDCKEGSACAQAMGSHWDAVANAQCRCPPNARSWLTKFVRSVGFRFALQYTPGVGFSIRQCVSPRKPSRFATNKPG
jgi:hypothetical protein